MNAKLEHLLNKVLSDSERWELGSLLESEPGSLTQFQRRREFDLLDRLMHYGLDKIQWTWQDFAPLTSSGRVRLLSTDGNITQTAQS